MSYLSSIRKEFFEPIFDEHQVNYSEEKILSIEEAMLNKLCDLILDSSNVLPGLIRMSELHMIKIRLFNEHILPKAGHILLKAIEDMKVKDFLNLIDRNAKISDFLDDIKSTDLIKGKTFGDFEAINDDSSFGKILDILKTKTVLEKLKSPLGVSCLEKALEKPGDKFDSLNLNLYLPSKTSRNFDFFPKKLSDFYQGSIPMIKNQMLASFLGYNVLDPDNNDLGDLKHFEARQLELNFGSEDINHISGLGCFEKVISTIKELQLGIAKANYRNRKAKEVDSIYNTILETLEKYKNITRRHLNITEVLFVNHTLNSREYIGDYLSAAPRASFP